MIFMSFTNSQNSQFELFPTPSAKATQGRPHRYLLKDLTLSADHTIVLAIVFLMAMVIFFSFGVEKGKRMVRASIVEAAGIARGIAPGAAVTAPMAPSLPSSVGGEAQGAPPMTVASPGVKEKSSSPGGAEAGVSSEASGETEAPARKGNTQDNMFTVQVASFKSPESARREGMLLKQKGYDILVLPKGKHSIVCVGKFGQPHEAKALLNKLKNRYNDCLVRRL